MIVEIKKIRKAMNAALMTVTKMWLTSVWEGLNAISWENLSNCAGLWRAHLKLDLSWKSEYSSAETVVSSVRKWCNNSNTLSLRDVIVKIVTKIHGSCKCPSALLSTFKRSECNKILLRFLLEPCLARSTLSSATNSQKKVSQEIFARSLAISVSSPSSQVCLSLEKRLSLQPEAIKLEVSPISKEESQG